MISGIHLSLAVPFAASRPSNPVFLTIPIERRSTQADNFQCHAPESRSRLSHDFSESPNLQMNSHHMSITRRPVSMIAAIITLFGIHSMHSFSAQGFAAPPEGIPAEAQQFSETSAESPEAWQLNNDLYLALETFTPETSVRIPRLANVVRTISWQSDPESRLNLQPEPSHWIIRAGVAPAGTSPILVLKLDAPARLFQDPMIVTPDSDNTIFLAAKFASTHGENLRFEPQPHKNTVGYWSNPKDTADWHFQVTMAGAYEIDILQGCGTGHGGSQVKLEVENQDVNFKVHETGHFQNFIWRTIGTVQLTKADKTKLAIIPQKKPGGAVMDVRAVRLVPTGAKRTFDSELADPNSLPKANDE